MVKSTAAPMARDELLDFYRRPGPMTSAGRYAPLFAQLPDDVGALARIVQGLAIDEFAADWYGVRISEERHWESHIRSVEQMVERILALDGQPLSAARSPELWAREREATHAKDALNAARRALPMVGMHKEYPFQGPTGQLSLLDLFEGRRQLIIYHFMFHRDRGEGCPGCSFMVDNFPHLSHLHARATTLALVSCAPLAELEPFKQRMGWTVPWYSSFGSDFNYDFRATTDEAVAPVEYNYRARPELESLGQTYHIQGEQPGLSVFLRDASRVYHTYSTYGRGLDLLLTTYNFLDLTPLGRGEGWGGMPDLDGKGDDWLRYHDRYENEGAIA